MSTPEQDAWDKKLQETWNSLPVGLDARPKQREAHRLMLKHWGRRPSGAGLPLKVRLGLWWARKKLKDVKPTEVNMSPFVKKLVTSLIFGLAPAWAVLQTALPGGITGEEWMLVIGALASAFWGKFSSNTTVFAPARKGETVTKFGPE